MSGKLLTYHAHRYRPGVGSVAVLEEENALPGAECDFAANNGDVFRSAGEAHSDVAWHVVRAFVGMDEIGSVFWYEVIEEGVQIRPR